MKLINGLLIFLSLIAILTPSYSQNDSAQSIINNQNKWYERVSIRGYLQVRYNRLLETNENLGCEQCDKSWGDGGGFFIRRARIIFYGKISDNIYFYIQPDFASSSGETYGLAQIRDAYFDISLDNDNEFRFRVGQSKIPFGFENLQSSQNRLPLDRNDALNSAVANERDLGVFFYWAPQHIRKLFSKLVKDDLKGSGDYGVVGFGMFNGQTANKSELNDSPHLVARVSYPISIGNQIIEPGLQAYTGEYQLSNSQLSNGVGIKPGYSYLDTRAAITFVLYPQPFGIQSEFNFGKGPQFDKSTDSIATKDLSGGYITLNYKLNIGNHLLFPFVRIQHYEGGKKHERDARSYEVNELELGLEWSPFKTFEFVAMYTISNRRYEDFQNQDNHQNGNLLRLQAQINF